MVTHEENTLIHRITLHEIMQALPVDLLNAYMYCDVFGFTENETAKILGCGRKAVAYRRKRSHQELRKNLQKK